MSESRVNVSVNGRDYPVGCKPGEEAKVAALGKRLDTVVRNVSASTGPVTESRLLVMAALIIVDSLAELEAAAKGGPSGPSGASGAGGAGKAKADGAAGGPGVEALAERLEKLAGRLEKLASGAVRA